MSSKQGVDDANDAYPGLVFETLTAYRRTAALKGAIDLDVFTAVAEGNDEPATLAARCHADARGIRILCDCMVALGFLVKNDDRYALTPTSAAFLDRRAPRYMGAMADFLDAPAIAAAFADVAAAVREGGTVLGERGTLEPEHPVWVDFARAMAARAALTAEPLGRLLALDDGRPVRLLDVAAGHGLFGITLARIHPRLAVTAVDWPAVLAEARRNADAAGVGERFATIAGDVFGADLGGPYDLVLLANFLHHFDEAECIALLRRLRAALAPGGRAATLDFVPDEDRTGPGSVPLFNLTMLVTTPRGEAHTFADYERMFAAAGFARSELHPLPPTPQRVVISHA
jgi:SAM-dependent methyltransferase